MINRLNSSGVLIVFLARASLFLFFIFATPIYATPTLIISTEFDAGVTATKDSISNFSGVVENTKIYVSSGVIIYNAKEIGGNIEIIQDKSFTKEKVSKKINKLRNRKKIKLEVPKLKKEENTRTSSIQFRQLPFESDIIFSKNGKENVIVPSSNQQLKMIALFGFYQDTLVISGPEKNNSKCFLHFTNDIHHRQMQIRPPPTI